MDVLFSYLVFPGFLFSASAGLFAGWIDRKLTARIQYRVGPPWYQNFVDILKLCYKETVVPYAGSRAAFLLSPIAGFLSMILVVSILGRAIQSPLESFAGDLIVVTYLLIIPALAVIIGASSSNNPFASIGASREMKLILGYELPFVLAMAVVVIKSHGALNLGAIINRQIAFGPHIASFSGALAFVVALLCIQAKLCLVPFDMSEAEQEIMAGALVEYSGFPLAVIKLTKALLLYALPVLLISLFWVNNLNLPSLIVKYFLILLAIILIKNTNPRLRIDQAMKFFWGPVSFLAVLSVVLALIGL
ncbi:MAG: NADH-quinone oxidoreductase subunit H [Candidatus Omnitrophica bacterium]|nr:NADH-quinone oxidoreductase subunit H [Candidatus Omnitrophota bacterium]